MPLQNLRVFSEYDSPARPWITPLIRIDMWFPKTIGYWGSIQMMRDRLADQIARLEAAPQGERAIMLWWLMTRELYVAKGADPLAIFEAGRVNTRRALDMLKPFSDEIKKRGIAIDLIYIDNEGGFGIFDIGATWIQKIMRSRRARAKLPQDILDVNVADLTSTTRPGFSAAKVAWDRYSNRLKYTALREVVYDSRYFEVRPSRSGAVLRPSVVNFWSVNPTFPIYDYNGWRLDNDSLMDGRSSGPSSYVGTNGGRYANRVHHWIWNDFINLLNHTRSCLGSPGAVVHPVLSHPNYCHPWIQEQLVAHLVRCGINWSQNKCAFLYWNANDPQTNDPILAQIMQRHDLAYPIQRALPEIPLDVDSVTTVDFTTTYASFLTNMRSVIGPP